MDDIVPQKASKHRFHHGLSANSSVYRPRDVSLSIKILLKNERTYFTATCPQAQSHPGMTFILFTGKESEQCIEWIQNENSNPAGYRSVTKTNKRFVARMQKDGTDYIGLMYTNLKCYARDDDRIFKSVHGYPCQYLGIRDGCTAHYVNYKVGTPLLPGYYIQGSNRPVSVSGNETENVKLLVSL